MIEPAARAALEGRGGQAAAAAAAASSELRYRTVGRNGTPSVVRVRRMEEKPERGVAIAHYSNGNQTADRFVYKFFFLFRRPERCSSGSVIPFRCSAAIFGRRSRRPFVDTRRKTADRVR